MPHGDTPDAVRNHPRSKASTFRRQARRARRLLVTKTLVIIGDPQVTTTPGQAARRHASRLRQDQRQRSGAVYMPAAQSGSPMTYVPTGSSTSSLPSAAASYSGEYIAFALPDSEVRPSGQQ